MTSEEQINRMREYGNNDIAFMHVSPKQNLQMFGRLVKAINPRIMISHHYDLWDKLFERNLDLFNDANMPAEMITPDYVLRKISEAVENKCPYTDFFIPEHQKWYQISTMIVETNDLNINEIMNKKRKVNV